jgi:predicted RNase H-like HicB family nuclease
MKNTSVASLQVSVITYNGDNSIIAYCPSLELVGCGYTETEALESFNIVLDEYIKYTTENGTLIADLEEHGWTIKGGRNFTPPKTLELLQRNKDFDEIVNKCDYKKRNLSFAIPV